MNWPRILSRFAGSSAERPQPVSTSADATELDAVDRLYAAAPRLEAGPGFGAAVHRRIAISAREQETRSAPALRNFLRRPLLVGATAIAVASIALTLLWGAHSPVKAEPVLVCQIKGMICEGCGRNVSEILSRVPGVRRAEVDVKTGRARVILERRTAVSLTQLSAALEKTKYFQISDVSVATEPEQP